MSFQAIPADQQAQWKVVAKNEGRARLGLEGKHSQDQLGVLSTMVTSQEVNQEAPMWGRH